MRLCLRAQSPPEASPADRGRTGGRRKGLFGTGGSRGLNILKSRFRKTLLQRSAFGASRSVDIALADGRKYRLGVSEQDLTVLNFIVEKGVKSAGER